MKKILFVFISFVGFSYAFGQSDDSFQVNNSVYKVISKSALTKYCFKVSARDINATDSRNESFYSNKSGEYLSIPLSENIIKTVIQKGDAASIKGVKKLKMNGYTLQYFESDGKRVYIAPNGKGKIDFIVLPIEIDFLQKSRNEIRQDRALCEIDCINKYEPDDCKVNDLACRAEKSWRKAACFEICMNHYPTRTNNAFQSISFDLEPVKSR